MAHNAIPSLATNYSPYSVLFGFEPTFPGWQRIRPKLTSDRIEVNRHEIRQKLIIQNELIERSLKLIKLLILKLVIG